MSRSGRCGYSFTLKGSHCAGLGQRLREVASSVAMRCSIWGLTWKACRLWEHKSQGSIKLNRLLFIPLCRQEPALDRVRDLPLKTDLAVRVEISF